MRLSDTHIKEHLKDGRIVIEPAPSSEMISGVTADLRLGINLERSMPIMQPTLI